jgi:hypothetical protein
MIGFDFEYYKPDTIDEAVKLFNDLDSLGKVTIYYGGGSEFISMARVSTAYADAVIDIKGIEECNQYKMDGDNLVIGAGVTLTDIAEGNLFPALSKAVKRIADHTMQGKITIGGNICGTIIYRETVLPLLVSDSRITLASKDGQREELLRDVFDENNVFNYDSYIVKPNNKENYCILPLHLKPGIIRSIYGEKEIKHIPSIYAYVPVHFVGDEIGKWGTAQQVFCYLHIVFSTTEELKETIYNVLRLLYVYSINNENLLFCLFDVDSL